MVLNYIPNESNRNLTKKGRRKCCWRAASSHQGTCLLTAFCYHSFRRGEHQQVTTSTWYTSETSQMPTTLLRTPMCQDLNKCMLIMTHNDHNSCAHQHGNGLAPSCALASLTNKADYDKNTQRHAREMCTTCCTQHPHSPTLWHGESHSITERFRLAISLIHFTINM